MKILKIIGGILLLTAAAILSFATLVSFIKAIFDSIREIKEDLATGLGYAFGSAVVVFLMVLLIIFMTKKGLKLIRKKVEPQDSIDQIGL